MKTGGSLVLTINGGLSSIKFALFELGEPLQRRLGGSIDGIGTARGCLRVEGAEKTDNFSRPLPAPDHTVAVNVLLDWIEQRLGGTPLAAAGHRVVHGAPNYSEPQWITGAMLNDVRRPVPLDPEHLSEEIRLTDAVHRRYPALAQVASSDTAVCHDLP